MDSEKWYVAIIKGTTYAGFVAVGSEIYRDYKQNALKRGIRVVAERFDVDSETVDRVRGVEGGEGVDPGGLAGLAERLEKEEVCESDAQKELDELLFAVC